MKTGMNIFQHSRVNYLGRVSPFSRIYYGKREEFVVSGYFHPGGVYPIFVKYSTLSEKQRKGQAKVEIIIPDLVVFLSSPLLPLSNQRKIYDTH